MSNIFVGHTKEVEKTRNWLVKLLRMTPMEVTFNKKDGSTRIMKCTLREEYLPEIEGNYEEKKRTGESLAVFDLDKKEWRSFRWNSIVQIKFAVGDSNG